MIAFDASILYPSTLTRTPIPDPSFNPQLCSDVPTQVQALSSGVSSWQVTTGNSIGTMCEFVDDARFNFPTSMTTIDYSNQQLTGTIPTEFGLLTDVTKMTLASNNFQGTNSAHAHALSLTIFDGCISCCFVILFVPYQETDVPPRPTALALPACSHHPRVHPGPIPTELGKMTKLLSGAADCNAAFLTSNRLSSTLPSQLGNLKNLTQGLSLHYNSIESSIPTELGNHVRLTSCLSLHSLSLSSSIPSEFGQLTLMEANLYLLGNSLSSALPSELGNMGMKAALEISYNKFNSTIPTELGQLSEMTYSFQMQSNSLSSTIPTQLARMSMMTDYFRLDSNKLCADVPTQVETLSVGVANWLVAAGNDLGTACCETLPSAHTCAPTSLPTVLPTLACPDGTTWDVASWSCTSCGIGKYSNTSSGGKYNSSIMADMVPICTLCPVGRLVNETTMALDVVNVLVLALAVDLSLTHTLCHTHPSLPLQSWSYVGIIRN